MTSPDTQAMLKWLNQNRRMLRQSYPNQYVAYNAKGMIAHDESLEVVQEIAKGSQQPYAIYVVPPRSNASIQIHPIYFRAVVRHEWIPDYPVKLKHREKEEIVTMLVDSGAEVSLISLRVGQDLGYTLADAETVLLAETIGGTVRYVLRDVEMTIDGYTFVAPVAWLQDETGVEQLLLGREVVFEKFNIEFRQAEERIIFTWR